MSTLCLGECECDVGYSRPLGFNFCDTLDSCVETGPCLNGGSCVDGNCLCQPGFTGHNCEGI